MINNPPPFKALRIPIIIPTKGRGFINQGSTVCKLQDVGNPASIRTALAIGKANRLARLVCAGIAEKWKDYSVSTLRNCQNLHKAVLAGRQMLMSNLGTCGRNRFPKPYAAGLP